MKRIGLIIIFSLLGVISSAKNVRIGLFYNSNPTQVSVNYNIGRYSFFSESSIYTTLSNKKDKVVFKANGDKVLAYYNNQSLGEQVWYRLEENTELNNLLLNSQAVSREYQGNFIIYAIKGKLKVVNEISIDKYTEGVIKGEAGYGYNLEYYKVQAVISRTYALHFQKHKKEGYDLCDHTHCQVYKGINTKSTITQAVNETSEEVLVDSSLQYINTLFHSNCGGHTVTSDFVWSKRLPTMANLQKKVNSE